MIESQLKPCGVTTPRVVAAFYAVERADFVPQDRRGVAYMDRPHRFGNGRELMAPLSLGYLLEEASLRPDDRALVIGAGTGYGAAVLSRLAGSVVALESDADLAGRARELLADRPNVSVVEGPLEAGWAAGAPYSFILIDGAFEEQPAVLVEQLAEGGRVAAIVVGDDGVARASLGRLYAGIVHFEPFADSSAAILPPFRKAPTFRF